MRQMARVFFDFAVADLARHQLMNRRTIPGFEPTTPGSYAPAVRVLDPSVAFLSAQGITGRADIDMVADADVVAAWAERHGRPYRLTLTGPAGGTWSTGAGRGDRARRRSALPGAVRQGHRIGAAGDRGPLLT